MHGVDVNGQFYDIMPSKKVETVLETLKLLIKHGMDVTAKDQNLSTPLHLASSSGNLEIVRILMESGADATNMDGSGRTPLHLASSWVSNKAASLLLCLMSHMLDINGQNDEHCRSPFREFTVKAEIVRLLIEHGADVVAHDEAHSTPLHLAAKCASAQTVRLLIEHGADTTAKDRSDQTPLHLALFKVIYSSVSRF